MPSPPNRERGTMAKGYYTQEEIDAMVAYCDEKRQDSGQVTYDNLTADPFAHLPQQSEESIQSETDVLEGLSIEAVWKEPVEMEYIGRDIPSSIRAAVKEYLKSKVQVVWHSICPKGVTTVALRVVVDDEEYRSVGSAKWRKPDRFCVLKGYDIAKERAMIELVDKILDTKRKIESRILVG